jgi:sterol O-acyltransferase
MARPNSGASLEPPAINNRSSSLDKAPQLVGQLNEDGIAHLQEDMNYKAPTRDSHPRSLKAALEAVTDSGRSTGSDDTASDTASEEDYDSMRHDPTAVVVGGKGGGFHAATHGARTPEVGKTYEGVKGLSKKSRPTPMRLKSIPVTLNKMSEHGRYVLTADDEALREILKLGIERVGKRSQSTANVY